MVNYHLVILTHGLWGKPAHMEYIESQINQHIHLKSPNEEVIVYKTGSHGGYLTYDGIDINGKRISDEIIAQTELLSSNSISDKVTKFSIIGYSLGGLIARYAIGVLYSKNYFENIEPINFITFCSPHVGVLNPMNYTVATNLFNRFVHHFLAHTGSQLFLKDKIEHRGKPLLAWMADPNSYFFISLKSFKYKSLYANIIHDRRTSWFTAGIQSLDPFNSMTNTSPLNITLGFVPKYETVVVDINQPIKYKEVKLISETSTTIPKRFIRGLSWLRVLGTVIVYLPIWFIFFSVDSIFQRIKMNRRVKEFVRDTSNNLIYLYEMINDETLQVDESEEAENDDESSYETNSEKERDYLSDFEQDFSNKVQDQQDEFVETVYDVMNTNNMEAEKELDVENYGNLIKLNFNSDQMFIINKLNSLGWKKYPVLIQNTKQTHAAAIYRFKDVNFDEGKVVIRHLIEETFQVS
ncbi:putative serine esterase-domain-containing protein [Scheffersomyces amazonensis]|uniref:putative serine esterase-domain-containing protein n=1 Tax=Scheffersomyces amazonensis TaxID=1078765 RepID=UPI00315D0AC0